MHPGTSPPSVHSWRTSMNSLFYAPTVDRPVGTDESHRSGLSIRDPCSQSACNIWTKITVPGQIVVPGQSQE